MARTYFTLSLLALLILSLSACIDRSRSEPVTPIPRYTPSAPLVLQSLGSSPVTSAPEATTEPTAEPTEEPVAQPTEEPTAEPTEEPTAQPTEEPTAEPTEEPVAEPTEEPVAEPTEEPVAEPTEEPVAQPTEEPVAEPTEEPVAEPTEEPAAEGRSEAAGEEEPTEEVATDEATEEVAEEASLPTSLSEMTEEAILAGLPEEVARYFPEVADAEVGMQIATTNACQACHSMQPGVIQIGPSWWDMGTQAISRVPGQSPALYLYNSIIYPNDFIVPGFASGLMIQTYGEILSDEELAHLIAYLLTLRGDEGN